MATEETSPAAAPTEPTKLVYMGIVTLTSGKLGYKYAEPIGEGLASPSFYVKRLVGYERVGQIIEVRLTDNGSSVYKAGRRVTPDVWPHPAHILEWDARSIAEEQEHKAEKVSRKAAAIDPTEDVLLALRTAYRKSTPMARGQLLAKFVAFITKP